MEYIVRRGLGKILSYDDRWKIDQLSVDENVLFSNRGASKYLKDKYNLTTQQYYNLCVYNNINNPKCKCGKDLIYYGKFKGYSITCGSYECRKDAILDSQQLWYKERKTNLEFKSYYEDICNKNRITAFKLHKSNPSIADNLNTVKSTAKRMMIGFINTHDYFDSCLFYILITGDDKFKFGISTERSIQLRLKYTRAKNYRILLRGSKYQVSKLEYYVKLNLNTITEYLEFKDRFKFVNCYVDALKKLNLVTDHLN